MVTTSYVIILNLTSLDFLLLLVDKLPLCSFPAAWHNYIDIDNVKNASNKNQFVSKLKKSLLNQIPLACNRIGCPVCTR
jgi:hypothetical protein